MGEIITVPLWYIFRDESEKQKTFFFFFLSLD